MMIDLEGLTGIVAFVNRAFWWFVIFGGASFALAHVCIRSGPDTRHIATVPALFSSVTFTVLASFTTLCAAFVKDMPYLYVYAFVGWTFAFWSARIYRRAAT